MPVKTIFIRLTFVFSVHVNKEMASNDFSPTTSSDSEVSEMEDYDLEVEVFQTRVLQPAMRKARKKHMLTIR